METFRKGRRWMPPSDDLSFTHTHAHTGGHVHMRGHVLHVHNFATIASLEQEGIIRSATINPNDGDAPGERHDALLDELPGDVRHVTCTSSLSRFLYHPSNLNFLLLPLCHVYLLLVYFSVSIPIRIFDSPSVFLFLFFSCFFTLMIPSLPFYSIFTFVVLSNSLIVILLFPSGLFILASIMYFDIRSYLVSTIFFHRNDLSTIHPDN